MSIRDLINRVNDSTIVLLDPRPDDEFDQRHLPGAINIPIEQLEQRVGALSANTEVIAYCKGQYCVLTMEAVNTCTRSASGQARGRAAAWRRKLRGKPAHLLVILPARMHDIGRRTVCRLAITPPDCGLKMTQS